MKITKIEKFVDDVNYYDISVEDNHNFVLENGTVVHNCGTGVGFSVEQRYVSQLPVVADEFHRTETTIIVEDSKTGWCKAFRELIAMLYAGQIPKWDMSRVRPAGEKLKTFGGRSSGPAPLEDLFWFTVQIFQKSAGRKLTSLEVHDLACMIANIVVVGGVRRSALISLSDLHDDRLRDAKNGQWWNTHGHRRLSNNSAVYEEKPEIGVFMREWLSLYDSKSGERGIFNRDAANSVVKRANEFRQGLKFTTSLTYRQRDLGPFWGCNPCSEIILRPSEFCNLSEVVIRPFDTLQDLVAKVELATIIGTFQSTLTKFKYINKKYQKNCEDERLLGVSLTGVFDHPLLNDISDKETIKLWLTRLRQVAIDTNKKWAKKLGIEESVAITCIKPSGTVSALVHSASGFHARHARHYIRHVRNDVKDPVTQMLKDQGVPWEADIMDPVNTVVFKFPLESPSSAKLKNDLGAIEHLELWLLYQKYWCDHKPSVTISVKEHEWMEVGAWVYKNFDWMSGVSFLPDEGNHVYKQAPFTTCSEEEFNEAVKAMPDRINWSLLPLYEKEDATIATQELACAAGGCEI